MRIRYQLLDLRLGILPERGQHRLRPHAQPRLETTERQNKDPNQHDTDDTTM
jgi:hypothetical protein